MYARNKKTGAVGDVTAEYDHEVTGILHRTQRPFRWKLGNGNIEFIEFASFNPDSRNYVKGGKVIKTK